MEGMDLYTMNEYFIPENTVDEFQSAIWTERYSKAGEVQLVVPAFPEYLDMLKEGTYLGLAGTKQVMELQTQSIENNLLTVKGRDFLGYLDERMHWSKTTDAAQPIGDYTVDPAKLGELIADRVDKMVINPVPFTGGTAWTNVDLDWVRDKIESLEIGEIDHTGEPQRWTVPVGPLYSVLSDLAEKDGLGIRLYLDLADPELGYLLKFDTYRGVDRTSSAGPGVELIRLTPNMDTLTDLKEIRSIDGYKNVVYVMYKGIITTHYEDPFNVPYGLNRRVMVTDAAGEPVGHKVKNPYYGDYRMGGFYGGAYEYTVVDDADIAKFREQHARDALANHNYIRALDGQVSQINEYKLGEDYGLGDTIELEGRTGVINNARITEYVRAQDNKGFREYPTLSVLPQPTLSPV